MGEIIRLSRSQGRDDARGYALAQAVQQLVEGIGQARTGIKTLIALLQKLAALCAAFKQLDDEVEAGEVVGVRKVSLQVSGGLDLFTIGQLAQMVSRQLDMLRVSADAVEIVTPAMVAGENGEGESER